MLEVEGAFTVELIKNKKVIESYSTIDQEEFKKMVENFTQKIKPKFGTQNQKDICYDDSYTIHMSIF